MVEEDDAPLPVADAVIEPLEEDAVPVALIEDDSEVEPEEVELVASAKTPPWTP